MLHIDSLLHAVNALYEKKYGGTHLREIYFEQFVPSSRHEESEYWIYLTGE